MIHINRFIDKVSLLESKRTKDVILPISEARSLRDEIAKLLNELYNLKNNKKEEDILKLEIKGGSFK